ncbi:hypothetical protein EBU94_00945 [bacterium]|nr:hypothetical protein [bacterium]NBO36061.1 hypothetical protein [bacterium]
MISILCMAKPDNSVENGLSAVSFIDKLSLFENKHRPFLDLILRPLLMLVVFLAVGYYTLWMSTNYVKADKFAAYIEKQIISDKEQDEVSKTRFDIIQTKLETIINQQVSYTEQLKAYNQLLSNFQKQVDSLDSRLMYLERNQKSN